MFYHFRIFPEKWITGPPEPSDYLFKKFPEMQPVSGPPELSDYHGVGTVVYGRRHYDEETGTYVKTLWFVLLYVPIFPLAAYRVATIPGLGWKCLGRVPVGLGPKIWFLSLLLTVVSYCGYWW